MNIAVCYMNRDIDGLHLSWSMLRRYVLPSFLNLPRNIPASSLPPHPAKSDRGGAKSGIGQVGRHHLEGHVSMRVARIGMTSASTIATEFTMMGCSSRSVPVAGG